MGASVRVYVRALQTYRGWVEVSAVTLEEAEDKALELPNVISILEARYDCPYGDEEENL